MGKPYISVIVPVYNAERFLSAAIDSVLAQTYKDWELILIDDGSTDRSSIICEHYASQCENFIRVIHQSNKGVSAARNVGLDVAQGKFIAFIDADDVITPEYLQTLYLRLSETSVDMAGAWHECVDVDMNPISCGDEIYDGRYQIHSMQFLAKKHPDFFGAVWGKLLRKALIDKYELRFSTDLCRGEDTLFMCSYASLCKKAAIINKKIYCYRKNKTSLLERTKSLWLEQSIRLVRNFLDFSCKNHICSDYVLETSLSMRADILGDFMKIQTSIPNMRNYLDILHSSECFQEYIRYHKPYRRIVMLLYAYLIQYTPKVIQPYIFTVLNRCRHYIKSVFLLIPLPATR